MQKVYKWLPLSVLALALFISVLDSTIISISIKAIVDDLHASLKTIQWVITGYSLMVAALMITGGKLGDILGYRRMFRWGAIIFAIGSLLASRSHTATELLVSVSVIEGIGAALMTPSTAALITAEYKDKDRAIAFGVYGAVAGAAATAGPIIGGFLTTHYSWRWNYLINPIVVVILLLGSFVLKEFHNKAVHFPDIPSIILSAVGMASLVYGIVESSTYGWFKPKEPLSLFGATIDSGGVSVCAYSLIIGIILLCLFVWRQHYLERQHREPLVATSLFRNSQFMVGTSVVALTALTQFGLIFALPIFYEGFLAKDAFHAGVAILPLTASMLLSAPIAGILVGREKVTPKQITQVGLMIMLAGAIVLRQEVTIHSTVWTLAPGMALFGLGFGCSFSQLANMVLSAVPLHKVGEASGVNNTFRQLGTSFGQALIGALLIAALGTRLTADVTTSPMLPPVTKLSIATSLTTSVESLGASEPRATHLPSPVQRDIIYIKNDAIVHGVQVGLTGTSIAAAATLSLSFFLPKVMRKDT